MDRILVISGPTACGKSNLALEIANFKDVAIINADSLQIYEGLPILSAQPTKAEQSQVKHFLYSHFQPSDYSSVGSWLLLAKNAVQEARKSNKLPIIVGGSGMYISKLIEGISIIPEIDDEVRNQARQLFEEIGFEEMQKKLIDLGGEEVLDKQRLIRSFEVLTQTKKPISWWQDQAPEKIFPNDNFFHINLNPIREELYANCNLRFEKMIKNGAFEEAKNLRKLGISNEKQVTKTLGFLEICDFLDEKISYEKMLEISTQKTRNYSKRQLTWFRNQLPNKHIFENSKLALNFLKNEI